MKTDKRITNYLSIGNNYFVCMLSNKNAKARY